MRTFKEREAGKEQERRRQDKRGDVIESFKSCGCSVCGYKRCLKAIDFHHVDGEKHKRLHRAGIAALNVRQLIEELKRCIVVCANCHREIHAGMTIIKKQRDVEGQGKLPLIE